MSRKYLYLLENVTGRWLVVNVDHGYKKALFTYAYSGSAMRWIREPLARQWHSSFLKRNTTVKVTKIGTVGQYMKEHFEDFL